MRKQFVKTVENLLENKTNTVLLLGDIGIFGFRNSFKNYPDRTYNIGILEQSTISLAAGLSIGNMIPIVHTIAPFLVERAFEQLKIDFGYQSLNGNFVTIGASYDYASLGCTHHCPGDISLLLTIPNMQIVCPGNSFEFDQLFNQSYDNDQPTYFRLSEYENDKLDSDVTFGKANLVKKSNNPKALIVVVGNLLQSVISATKDLDCDILYYTTLRPFDEEALRNNFNDNIIVVEPFYEGSINYQINIALKGYKYKLTNIGVTRQFLTNYGSKTEHDSNLGLDVDSIKERIKNEL